LVHPPLLVDGVEEEPLHDLEVVVVVVPAVVKKGQVCWFAPSLLDFVRIE